MTDLTMLVNAEHPLPLDWEPDDLIELWKVQPRHYYLAPRSTKLVSSAAEAANELFAFAEQQGIEDYTVLSAYRDSDYQAGLFASGDNDMVARPGCSEHQTGLAMDISQFAFGRHPLDGAHVAWLVQNCWNYGFILRYPLGREDVTGIPAEPWHFRYVGRDAALEMRDRGWVLEEWHTAHGG